MKRSVYFAAAVMVAFVGGDCLAQSNIDHAVNAMANAAASMAQDSPYGSVLASPIRTDADKARDEARHTTETLAFAEVMPGQTIGDMIIGGGYFTRVFSAAVGPTGKVIAWQPAQFIGFQASYADAIAAADAMPNVEGVRSPLGVPEFPAGMDLVFTAQNYHDLHLRPFAADTAAKTNAAVFAALKPGGLYVIVDHYAAAGSGLAAADSLHRIDPAIVKEEVEAAGFVLEAQNDILKNDADPLTANVFDPAIRGHTSQFILKFRKPA
jgi:predicted methyltransferase